MKVDRNTLREWFEIGDFPTQEQFYNWFDSFWHKDDTIPYDSVYGLEDVINSFYEVSKNAKVSFVEVDNNEQGVAPLIDKPKEGDIVFKQLLDSTIELWVFDNDSFDLKKAFNPPHWNDIEGKPTFFSGNWEDLGNKPTNATPNSDGLMAKTDKTSLNSLLIQNQKAPSINNNVIDWKYGVGKITASGDLVLSFENLRIGTYFLVVEGDFSITFPNGFDYGGGERSSDKTYYQVTCLDADKEEGIYSIIKKEV